MDKLIDQIAAAVKAKVAEAKKSWPKDAVHPDVTEGFVRIEVAAHSDAILEAAVAAVLAVSKPAAVKKRA